MFWHQVGVAAEPVTGTLDLHDDRMVEQPVQQRVGGDAVTEDLALATVRGEDHCPFLVTRIDEVEEQVFRYHDHMGKPLTTRDLPVCPLGTMLFLDYQFSDD